MEEIKMKICNKMRAILLECERLTFKKLYIQKLRDKIRVPFRFVNNEIKR